MLDQLAYKVDPALEPTLKVQPQEPFTVKVQNAFGRSFDTVEEFEAFLAPENEAQKRRLNHPCTGPIEVITDRRDISLAIHVLDLKTTRGYQCISKSTGVLKSEFEKRQCAIYEMGPDEQLAFKHSDLLMRASPKLGFIATIDEQQRSPGRACENGGNIDLNFLDKGSVIYLPVNFESPRLLVGDLHVCQGNGEASGVGVEADGEVTLMVEIVDKINFPIINHKHNLVVVGWGQSVDESLACSVRNTIQFFARVFPFCHWDEGEIYKFISAEGNLTLGNSTGKVKTCGCVFYKQRLTNKFGFPVL